MNQTFTIVSKSLAPSETIIFLEGHALRKCSELQVNENESGRLNNIQDETISNQIYACFQSVHNILSSHLLHTNVKIHMKYKISYTVL